MMLNKLIGLDLDSCTISGLSYDFEFSGKLAGEFFKYSVSTSSNVCFNREVLVDIGKLISENIWGFFSNTLLGISEFEDENKYVVVFQFEGGKELIFWQKETDPDNLILVKNKSSGAWSVTE